MNDLEFLQTFNLTTDQIDLLFEATQWCDQVWRTEAYGYPKDSPGTETLAQRFADVRYRELLLKTLAEQDAPAALIDAIAQLT